MHMATATGRTRTGTHDGAGRPGRLPGSDRPGTDRPGAGAAGVFCAADVVRQASRAETGGRARDGGWRAGAPAVVPAIARLAVIEAARGRFAWLVAGFVLAGLTLALFAGELAITESRGFRAGILGAWLRSCAVFTIGLAVVASVVREFDDKGVEVLVALPVPRAAYVAGKLIGFAGVASAPALACALALAGFAPPAQVAIWAASLYLELLVVVSIGLLCVTTFVQVTLAMSVSLAFYLLSRSMAAIQLMVHEPAGAPETAARQFVRVFVDALAFLVPDLDRFTESEWLIHGTGTVADLGFAAAQSAVYVALLGAACAFDLHRKAL